MRHGSFDSPTVDCPSYLSVPSEQMTVSCLSSDRELDGASPLQWDTAGASPVARSSSSPDRRTCSAACLRRPTDDDRPTACRRRRATTSMPNLRWSADDTATAVDQCVCDRETGPPVGMRTSVTSLYRPGSPVGGPRSVAAESTAPRSRLVSRSDPNMLKLASPNTASCERGATGDSRYSRPSSLDRPERQRQRSLPHSRDTLLLPVCQQHI